ncbi:MAG: hypothetical protein LLG06_02880 [Desulfobacteraceae bacterium]|nr:hypothetical protein [Desulfobacteraceae bacterium]
MEVLFYIGPAALLVALGAGYWFFRSRMKATKEIHSHESEPWMGAIRVTDRNGRDMLIVRKDDGSFEMHEEQTFRKQRS